MQNIIAVWSFWSCRFTCKLFKVLNAPCSSLHGMEFDNFNLMDARIAIYQLNKTPLTFGCDWMTLEAMCAEKMIKQSNFSQWIVWPRVRSASIITACGRITTHVERHVNKCFLHASYCRIFCQHWCDRSRNYSVQIGQWCLKYKTKNVY